jgi:hypothetical protein
VPLALSGLGLLGYCIVEVMLWRHGEGKNEMTVNRVNSPSLSAEANHGYESSSQNTVTVLNYRKTD